MSSDLERITASTVGRQADEKFPQPPFWTSAGITDRQHEGEHRVAMRDLRRQTEEKIGEQVSRMLIQMVRLEADDRVVTELKLELNRQYKLSRALDENDPELKAKFAIIDDDFFGRARTQLLEWF